MLITEQIGALTFTPEVKRVTFNGSQVREFRDTMEKMLAVIEAAKAFKRVVPAYPDEWHKEHLLLGNAIRALETVSLGLNRD